MSFKQCFFINCILSVQCNIVFPVMCWPLYALLISRTGQGDVWHHQVGVCSTPGEHGPPERPRHAEWGWRHGEHHRTRNALWVLINTLYHVKIHFVIIKWELCLCSAFLSFNIPIIRFAENCALIFVIKFEQSVVKVMHFDFKILKTQENTLSDNFLKQNDTRSIPFK